MSAQPGLAWSVDMTIDVMGVLFTLTRHNDFPLGKTRNVPVDISWEFVECIAG